jgi:hypothetical protein
MRANFSLSMVAEWLLKAEKTGVEKMRDGVVSQGKARYEEPDYMFREPRLSGSIIGSGVDEEYLFKKLSSWRAIWTQLESRQVQVRLLT